MVDTEETASLHKPVLPLETYIFTGIIYFQHGPLLCIFALLLTLNYIIFTVLALFILRLVIQLFIFHKTLARLNEKGIWLLVPLFEIMLILINTALTFSAFLSKETKWK